MSGDRKYFGLWSRNSFSLKNRLWARLIEKLATMKWEQDLADKEIYRFLGDNSVQIILRIATKSWEEGYYRVVELLDSDGSVLVKEKFHSDGLGGSYAYHPLSELFELVEREPSPDMEEIRSLTQTIEMV